VPSSLESLVESSDVALGVLELPSSTVLVANAAMAKVLRLASGAIIGSTYLDLVVPDQRQASGGLLRALAEGALTGYRATRSLGAGNSAPRELALWVCAVDVEGARLGLVSAAPLHGASTAEAEPITAMLSAPAPGHVLLGMLDHEWRIDRISHDVVEMLGFQPEEVAGLPILGALYPGDAPSFLAAVEHARIGRRTVWLTVRVRAKSGTWSRVAAVLATLTEEKLPALAFAFVLPEGDGTVPCASSRAEPSRLEAELCWVTHDLRLAGMVPRLDCLPDATRSPGLSALTARERTGGPRAVAGGPAGGLDRRGTVR
jgi:hypothetical protein